MSEARDLNDASQPDRAGTDPANSEIESLLRSLVPRQPALDRDLLFFEAGKAAAGRSHNGRWLARTAWPAVAASLLVACGALAVQLARKSTALEAALAAAPKPADAVASDDVRAGQGTSETHQPNPAAGGPRTPSGEPGRLGSLPRRMEPLVSLDRIPGRQLTAQGWVEAPPGSPAWQIEPARPKEPESTVRPPRRPTYLELLRSDGA